MSWCAADDPPAAVIADILPTYLGPSGGGLFLQATEGVRETLIDEDGTRRPIALC